MASKLMKTKKCPGEDRMTTKIFKLGGSELREAIRVLLNKCIEEQRIPKNWQGSEVILQKGDQANLENHRPISLLYHL